METWVWVKEKEKQWLGKDDCTTTEKTATIQRGNKARKASVDRTVVVIAAMLTKNKWHQILATPKMRMAQANWYKVIWRQAQWCLIWAQKTYNFFSLWQAFPINWNGCPCFLEFSICSALQFNVLPCSLNCFIIEYIQGVFQTHTASALSAICRLYNILTLTLHLMGKEGNGKK